MAGLWALLGGRGREREREAGPVAKEKVLLSSPRRRFTRSVTFHRGVGEGSSSAPCCEV